MLDNPNTANTQATLRILTQNVRKSPTALAEVVNNAPGRNIDIALLQEIPFKTSGQLTASQHWSVILPATHTVNSRRTRTAILVRSQLATSGWEEIITKSGDATGIRLRTNI